MPPDETLVEQLRATTRFRELWHVPSCDSTQDLAADPRFAPGLDAIVWADAQAYGRGRFGRVWHGAAGHDIEATFRIVDLDLPEPAMLAAALPAAIADALQPHTDGHPIRLKWPNDLYCGGRKLAGLLIDATGNPPRTFVLGVGINTNRTEFPAELRDAATSLALLTGRRLDRAAVLLDVARAIDEAVTELARHDHARLGAAFRERLGLVGRHVRMAESARVLAGVVTALDLRHAHLDGIPEPVRLARVLRIETIG